MDVAVTQHHPVVEGAISSRGLAAGTGQGGLDPVPGLVAHPGDGAGRGHDPLHERVGAAGRSLAQQGGHPVLLLQVQAIAGPTGLAVQRHPHVEQGVVGPGQHGVVAGVEDGLHQLGPVQGVHVPQATAALLQVRLEQEGHLTGLGVAGDHALAQLGEPLLGPLAPLGEGPLPHLLGELRVAGEVADLEERRGGVEVVGGEAEGLLRGAHGVTQLHPLVPDRVPEPVGDRADRRGPPVVQEQQVEVAVRGQLATPVPPGGGEGDARRPGGGEVEEADQPTVDQVAQGPAPVAAGDAVGGDEGVALLGEGHEVGDPLTPPPTPPGGRRR